MNSTSHSSSIDGFDPLEIGEARAGSSMLAVLEEAGKREVHNILKSYTGYFDLFSEMLQNSLDAVQLRQRLDGKQYQPRIWVTIDIPAGIVRVADNGVGMNEEEFKYCLRPSVSFKRYADLRGHKGVGATFLAYGFSFLKLQSKKGGSHLAAVLRQGRQWAEDTGSTVPRPKFEATEFSVPELEGEESGTCFEVLTGKAPGERPQDLAWLGAQTADQWYTVLRIKTPLGGVYLLSQKFTPRVNITVVSSNKSTASVEVTKPEYYYPHEIPNLNKVEALRDLVKALNGIKGDARTKFEKLPAEFKRLDCLYEIWGKGDLLDADSDFTDTLTDEQTLLIERHNVVVYACFLRSAKIWNQLNDEEFRLRKGLRILRGGLQLASDFMVQGDLSIIPLTSTIGYQANAHIVVHFTDGNPDMGRKVFQPELKGLAETLSVRSVTVFKRYLQHLQQDTGAQTLVPDKDLYEWKKEQEAYRDANPLAFVHDEARVALISKPRQEQDVIALFHELVGAGILKGFRFYGTSQSERYDSLFHMEYLQEDRVLFEAKTQHLGVTRQYEVPYTTHPMVLEYKFTFDSLVDDFEKEEKFAKQIDLVVCWSAGAGYKAKFDLSPLLISDEGSSRKIFGATHQAFAAGEHAAAPFEVIVLEDLLNWLRDSDAEEARQRVAYRDL